MAKVQIGAAYRHAQPTRTARTMAETHWGPYARLDVERRDPDRLVGWTCAAILALCVIGLLWERLA